MKDSMPHDHTHSHAHDNTDHTVGNIRVAFFLNLAFALLEIVGGLWTNSVAILSDAVHDLGDSLSLGSAWFLEKYSRKQRDQKYSYGYRRFSVLGSLLNAGVLIGGSIFVLSEAIPRLLAPQESNAEGMVVIAIVGIIINGAAVFRLRGDKSLNASVVAWHLLEDVLGWVALLIMSIVLYFTDWYLLDPILSIAITLYVLYNAARYLRKSLHVFLQGVPDNIDVDQLEQKIAALTDIKSVHHTHVWTLDGERHVLTTHVVLEQDAGIDKITDVRCRVEAVARSLGLSHTTVQIEREHDDCTTG